MGQPIPAQHPSVVLRSHFKLVRTLLVVAMLALLALAAAVVILANDDDQISTATKATPQVQPAPRPAGVRYDGGPDEGTRGAVATPQLPTGIRYDGGPDEGTRGAISASAAPAANSRYDGGPEEGSRGPEQAQFKQRAGGPTFIHEGR